MFSPRAVPALIPSLCMLALVCARSPWACAQSESAPAPSSAENDALSGPKVDEAQTGPTLIERNFDGTLKKPEVRPEEAAARRLRLSDPEKSRVDAVLSERSAELDAIVRANIETLLKVQTARASGDKKTVAEATKELTEALRPLVAKGRLAERIAGALEPANAEHYNRMLRDYYRALINDGRKERPRGDPMDEMNPERATPAPEAPRADPPRADPPRASRVMLEVLGQEVRRSYERIAAEGQARLEEISERLDLTAEQRAKVTALASEFGQKSKLNPTPAQRAELFGKVLAELTPEQRIKAVELIRGR